MLPVLLCGILSVAFAPLGIVALVMGASAKKEIGRSGGSQAGGGMVSAGMALEVFDGGLAMLDTSDARRRLAFHDGLRQLMRCVNVLEEARFPVIAAVQGGCIGGALDLAAADLA